MGLASGSWGGFWVARGVSLDWAGWGGRRAAHVARSMDRAVSAPGLDPTGEGARGPDTGQMTQTVADRPRVLAAPRRETQLPHGATWGCAWEQRE